MKNSFLQIQGDSIIIDKNQLIMYAALALAAIVLIIVIVFAFKHRKKNFIKTIPTNLKEVK